MMKRFRPAGIVALTAALVSSSWAKTAEKKILGDVTWPAEWTVFAPAGTNAPPLPAAALRPSHKHLEQRDHLS